MAVVLFFSALPLSSPLFDRPLLFLSTARLLICSDKDVAVLEGDDPIVDEPLLLFSPIIRLDRDGMEEVGAESLPVRLAARAASCSANDDIVLLPSWWAHRCRALLEVWGIRNTSHGDN